MIISKINYYLNVYIMFQSFLRTLYAALCSAAALLVPTSSACPISPQVTLDLKPPLGCSFVSYLIAICLLYTSPSPRDATLSRMPSSA